MESVKYEKAFTLSVFGPVQGVCNRGKVLCCNRVLCYTYPTTALYTGACWSGPLRLRPWGAKPASHPSPANSDPQPLSPIFEDHSFAAS